LPELLLPQLAAAARVSGAASAAARVKARRMEDPKTELRTLPVYLTFPPNR
jgi:hypothetical protein